MKRVSRISGLFSFSSPSLRNRLMSLTGTIFLLTLLVTGVIISIFTRNSEAAAWRGRQGEAARAAATSVVSFIDKAESILSVGFILGQDPVDYQHAADQMVRMSSTFLEVIRLDSKGNIQSAASNDLPVLANLFTIPQSQWFRVAAAGRTYHGSVQVSAKNEPYLILSVPLPDGGIAAGRLRMDVLQNVVSNIQFGSTGTAYVFNPDGQIIAHTNHQLALDFVNIAGRPEYQAVMQTPDHQWYGAYVNLQGVSVVGASAQAANTDWFVLTELNEDEAFASSRNVWWIIGGLLVFMILMEFVVRALLVKSVFTPIGQLKAGALAIGEGDFDHRIGLNRTDEIGILASAFDAMAAQVGEQRLELEKRVAERTAELSALNRRLARENEEKTRLYSQVQTSLKEKEILLKEIHHRVKNNLQVISSLLSLQSAQIKEPLTAQLFRDSQNRVRSMALIHEKLYQSRDLARIDFKGYIDSLSSYLTRSFAVEARGIQFHIEVDDISLEIDQAIPCGLIITELISNSLKYAFPNKRQGEVWIRFNMDANRLLHLNVGDDGVGIPETIDFQNTTSLGLQLVNSLVMQLEGTVELVRRGGTEFQITFPEMETK
jgi:two-component sensor histidine kinase